MWMIILDVPNTQDAYKDQEREFTYTKDDWNNANTISVYSLQIP